MKLKPKEFRCIYCQAVRQRGVTVKLQKGYVVKVCKNESCKLGVKEFIKINF